MMYFECKNFVGTDNGIIDVVASDSAMGLLKTSEIESIKVWLPLHLSLGKFNSLEPFNRNELLQYDENVSYNFEEDVNRLKELMNDNRTIRVWASHTDINEYRLLLLICYLFKNNNISVFFAEDFNKYAFCIGSISDDELINIDKKEHVLTQKQKEDYSDEWIKIVNEDKNSAI